jgi:hypothetical protein
MIEDRRQLTEDRSEHFGVWDRSTDPRRLTYHLSSVICRLSPVFLTHHFDGCLDNGIRIDAV